MSNLEILDSVMHAGLKISSSAGIEFARSQHLMSLRVTEIDKALCNFPIFIFRSPRSGLLSLAALTSYRAHSNLFVRDTNWEASYLPATMQTHPFHPKVDKSGQSSFQLAFEIDSPVLSNDDGVALFDSNGKPSAFLAQIRATIDAELKNEFLTRQFLQTIDDLNLLLAIDLDLTFDDGRQDSIKGLLTIDENKLNSLDDSTVLDLHKRGYLIPIHGLLMSLYQANSLIKRHNKVADYPVIKTLTLNRKQ